MTPRPPPYDDPPVEPAEPVVEVHVPETRPQRDRPYRNGAGDAKRIGHGTLAQALLPSGLYGILAERNGVELPPLSEVFTDEPPLAAELYHDVWVVRCPTVGCGDVVVAWRAEALFMCTTCWNGPTDGKWRRVGYPDEVLDIEEVLGYRMISHERNWYPTESLQDVIEQNKQRGDGVPARFRR